VTPVAASSLLDERLPLTTDRDVATARRRTKTLATTVGLDDPAAARFAAAVSEVARNAVQHGGGGTLAFELLPGRPSRLVARVRDHGPGMAELHDALATRHGEGGLGRALRLVPTIAIERPDDGGTEVTVWTALRTDVSREVLGAGDPAAGRASPDAAPVPGALDPDRLAEENRRLAQELEETNRGVVALYAELDDKAEQLRQASELKSRFLSNVSHEFRTPLGSIIALAGLLAESPLQPEQATQVRFVAQAARDLSALVDDLLDLARVEAGRIPLHEAPFELDDFLRGLRGSFDPLVAPDGVALVFEEPSDLPPILSDQLRLGQIVRNFVSNALKFTEHGAVRVTTRVAEAHEIPPDARLGDRVPQAGETDEFVVIDVSDTGIGIAPEDQARIFEEFVQVESPLQARVKGTGLGLPLARRLAALLGGAAWVRSEPGRGSTFSVAIPMRTIPSSPSGASLAGHAPPGGAPAPVPTTPASDAPAPTPLGSAASGDRTTRGPILVVDDDPVMRYVLMGSLRDLAPSVAVATDGTTAVEAIRRLRPSLIVLDLELPGIDGSEVLRLLRVEPASMEVPVIIHTGRDLDEDVARPLRAHAQAIVRKDDPGTALRDVARRLLDDGSPR
jgi:signal transduction histidine kinase/CheY-like chemotaxis protein